MSAKSFSEMLKEHEQVYDILQQGTQRQLTQAEFDALFSFWSTIVGEIVDGAYVSYEDTKVEKAKLLEMGYKLLEETLVQWHERKKEPFGVSFRIELTKRIVAKIQSKRE